MQPGNIVRCRNREWVLLPSDDVQTTLLRPLAGATDEVVALHGQLSVLIPNIDKVEPATFPLPTVDDLADASSAELLWQAARLTLREGAAPFRSLGRISIRPRVYQFVPLLMALRLDPVRLLVADDVGVGKTIEAILIARELLDRGEIRGFCVLCPPYLCEQWQRELSEKFNLDAVIVRSGTVGQLERRKPSGKSIYAHYRVQVISIDFVKSDRNRHQFMMDCPQLVIVDEAHGAAHASDQKQIRHQRHALVRQISEMDDRHLVLLTATPHSGIEDSFRSLISLLNPEFGEWETKSLSAAQRDELSKHFVQRTREDIKQKWESNGFFPTRDPSDETYRLSKGYAEFFRSTYDFCSEIVRSGRSLDRRQQRVRYWAALALMRCVMSSPVAAVGALKRRQERIDVENEEIEEERNRNFIFESDSESAEDDTPSSTVESAESSFTDRERNTLTKLSEMAQQLAGPAKDKKVARCTEIVSDLLNEGFYPIIWCRFVDTADYVAATLAKGLKRKHKGVRVVSITGRLGDEERREKVRELGEFSDRVLVATDCLSEGINLQDSFNAVLHYDLPWNPNRLEQREGRVDRYGQKLSDTVKSIRFFSPDSAIDGVVIEVLLDKARTIHESLGTHVPVPDESESVTEALLSALFLRGDAQADTTQLALDFGEDERVTDLHHRWQRDVDREKINRTRFAQRALKPEEVHAELDATDAVLGDPTAVKDFVLAASQRIGLQIHKPKRGEGYIIAVSENDRSVVPRAIRQLLPTQSSDKWRISFDSPTPEACEYLGRNHRFVSGLARFLMEESMTKGSDATVSRCGVIRTNTVDRLTVLLSLRVRYLLSQPEKTPLLCEEVVVSGIQPNGKKERFDLLADDDALRLLGNAMPDANVPMSEKQELVAAMLERWPLWQPDIEDHLRERSAELEKSYKRIRRAVSLRVRELSLDPQLPPDLLGLLILQPVAES